MITALIAAAWGFAEATLFFIVPDVYLTLVALEDIRRALRACAFAVAGALLGGALMYVWGAVNPAVAEAALDAVPAVSAAMVERVQGTLRDTGLPALFLGPLSGTPYKIYAVESGRLGLNLAAFLLVSVPARAIRFVLLTALAGWISMRVGRRWSVRRKQVVGLLLWAAFYAGYLMLWR